MSRTRRTRRVATLAVYGGGGLGLLAGAGWMVLIGEAKLARRWVGVPQSSPPRGDGLFGDWTQDGPRPVTVALLGDSSAAGFGVRGAAETPGATLAAGLAGITGGPVRLVTAAVVGARSQHLGSQVEQVRADQPDVVVIMIGANDVTGRVRPAEAVAHLGRAVRRLRSDGAAVVVCTCPDLGTVEPIAQPLRFFARLWSRQMAAAQTIAVVEAGGRTVSLGDVLGPEFAARPKEMFSPDRFHPSAAGYAAAVSVTLPSVCAALGVWPEDAGAEMDRRLFRPDGMTSIASAAARAAGRTGSEVTGARLDGRERGPRGRWAFLRRREPRPVPESVEPAADRDAHLR